MEIKDLEKQMLEDYKDEINNTIVKDINSLLKYAFYYGYEVGCEEAVDEMALEKATEDFIKEVPTTESTLEDVMNIKMQSFINNFSSNIQDIELLKHIYRTAFIDGAISKEEFFNKLLMED